MEWDADISHCMVQNYSNHGSGNNRGITQLLALWLAACGGIQIKSQQLGGRDKYGLYDSKDSLVYTAGLQPRLHSETLSKNKNNSSKSIASRSEGLRGSGCSILEINIYIL